jgi:zinc transporter
MARSNGIVFGWTFDGQGGGRRLEIPAVAEEIRNAGLSWVHLNAAQHGVRAWLQREVTDLDKIILDALLAEETRPRTIDNGDGMLLILRGVNLNPDAHPEDMVSLRMWIDAERIITLERRKVQSIHLIDKELKSGIGPKTSGDFLAMLCGQLFENLDESLGRLNDRLDALEENIVESPGDNQRSETLEIRRAAITFRRYVAPQRDVLAHLRFADQSWLGANHKRAFQENLDQVIRTLEDLDLIRERAQISHDTLDSALAHRVNKNIYLLSGIATIFMPLTFITGLLGMNVKGIPAADHPHAFIIICSITIGLALLQGAIFKWKKWF